MTIKRIWSGGLQPRHAIVLFAAVIGIVLTALVAYELRREYVDGIEAAGLKTQNLTRVLEEHARQSLRRVELSILRAADEIKGAGDIAQADLTALRGRLRDLLPTDGMIRAFALIDRDGAIILSTLGAGLHGLPTVADSDYFVAQRERGGLGMVIGATVKSRVDGRWLLPFSYRLAAPGATFQGVLLAVVEPAYFQSFYDSIDTGANGFVTLFLRTGWIAVRSPFNDSVLSLNWADSPMFRVHLPAAESNTVRQVVVADGIERVYSYRALKEYPVIVSVGLSLTDGLATWRTRTWHNGILLLIALAALAGASLALSRQLRRRESAEMELRRLSSIVESTSDVVVTSRVDGQFVYMNAAARRGAGLGEDADVSRYRNQMFYPPEHWAFVQHVARPAAVKDGVWSGENRLRAADGREFDVSQVLLAHLDARGDPEFFTGISRDITERKQAEGALRESRTKLEALTRRLLEVQETERRMLARELHDEVGGVLTAVKLNLQSLRGKCSGDPGEAALSDGLALVDGAIQTVRSLSLELRPAVLDDLGLIPALKWYCERQVQRAGIAIELALDAIDLKRAPQLESACFRIVQESVTNALRHANARRIHVALRRGEGSVALEIADDGGGFDAAAARRRGLAGECSGLQGMEERAMLLGGRLGVDSAPGAGTRVRVEFAIPEGGFA